MSNRHISRQVVMQTMYELDTNSNFTVPQEELKKILERNIVEFATEKLDKAFAVDLLLEILSRVSTIDEILSKSAPEWPLEKIGVVDRNILRIGLCEMLFFQDKVPPKVAIDEAIELAKEFGGESTSKFINGVLGAVYKELGEPGKDSKSKGVTKHENKSGALIYNLGVNKEINLAFVHDVFGRWTLPKSDSSEGLLEENLIKEIKSKINLDIEIVEKISELDYVAHNPTKGKVNKKVSYFLARSLGVDISINKSEGGLDDAKWFVNSEVDSIISYEDLKEIISSGIKRIKEIENIN